MRLIACLPVLAAFAFPAYSQQIFKPTEDVQGAMRTIQPHTVSAHMHYLADDLLEGRAPGSRGDLLARTYIATQMQQIGLKPGGENGTYYQRVPIINMQTDPAATLTIDGPTGQLSLRFVTDFVGFTGMQQPETSIRSAEVVFVGYGIDAPEQGWNDYKDVDVSGKVLLMMNNDPAGDDPSFFGGNARTYYGRWTYKYEIAARKGAAGAIIIHTTESAGYGWNVIEGSWSRERSELKRKAGTPAVPLKAWVTSDACSRMLTLAGKTIDELQAAAQARSFTPIPLGIRLSTSLKTSMRTVETANVLGVMPGRDPVLSRQAVVLTAHYDHFGIARPVDGDSIYNGAQDNASGVSGLLNVAEAFMRLPSPPRRTVIFAAVGAEESGLIGSQYFAENPTVAPGLIAANINIDGLNLFGRTRDIVMIGLGKSSIDSVVRSVALWQKRELKGDQFPEQGSFYRSDQFNFAKIGVPCAYLESGIDYIDRPSDFGKQTVEAYIKKNYHQPSDEMDPTWDFRGAVEDLQLTFLVARTIAENDHMPVWNPGDEFEGIRKKK